MADEGQVNLHQLFQSTHPSRGETICKLLEYQEGDISIHSPLAG